MPNLFDSLKIRDVTLRNRIGVSPMCQYSYNDGFSNDWHLVHLGSRAVGGAGLVMVEASGVEARGRITPGDLGIYKDEHVERLSRVANFIKSQGAVAGIQIAHAGRKASAAVPWEGGGPVEDSQDGWQPLGPDEWAFGNLRTPRKMSVQDIHEVRHSFVAAAKRAAAAGFQWLEIHAAHGYLLHSFYSPLTNGRDDSYGGSLENRMRFVLEVARDVRAVWPANLPLATRLSCSDWTDGGWDIEQSIELSRRLKNEGVDLIDCSSGGNVASAKIPTTPGYQVPFAGAIRKQANVATAAVGLITEAKQADEIIQSGKADVVLLAREMLRDPYWAYHAAVILGQKEKMRVPQQYGRAW
jgi:2,4-dienoyl-CoA reductase-like NADH-dependent reductase (Old Yellow Enzyme family)